MGIVDDEKDDKKFDERYFLDLPYYTQEQADDLYYSFIDRFKREYKFNHYNRLWERRK